MNLKSSSSTLIVAIFIIGALTSSFTFADAPTQDACLLLTQAQVGDAVGVAVGAGTHVTPQFLKTCTWTPTAPTKEIRAITLNIQPGDTYDSGKKHTELGATAGEGIKLTAASGIGDDAYYVTVGPSIMLFFKKGTLAFKVAIYGALASEKSMAAEKALALGAISKL